MPDWSVGAAAVFFVASALSFIVGLAKSARLKSRHMHYASTAEGGGMKTTGLPPDEWFATVTQQLRNARDHQPELIPHIIHSIIEREILRQDDQTAQAHLIDFRTAIEGLKLTKQYREMFQDISMLKREEAKRLKTLELEILKLDNRRQVEGEKVKFEALKERKALELEIAKLDQEIEAVKNPPQAAKPPNPNKQLAKRHAKSEARLAKLRKLRVETEQLPEGHEQALKLNAIDDEIELEMEEWKRTL